MNDAFFESTSILSFQWSLFDHQLFFRPHLQPFEGKFSKNIANLTTLAQVEHDSVEFWVVGDDRFFVEDFRATTMWDSFQKVETRGRSWTLKKGRKAAENPFAWARHKNKRLKNKNGEDNISA